MIKRTHVLTICRRGDKGNSLKHDFILCRYCIRLFDDYFFSICEDDCVFDCVVHIAPFYERDNRIQDFCKSKKARSYILLLKIINLRYHLANTIRAHEKVDAQEIY